jgi:hypothetical protein
MSKKLLIAALTALSVSAISGAASAGESRHDQGAIVLASSSIPSSPVLGCSEGSLPGAFGGLKVEAENNHIVQTGLWSGVKKVGGAVKKAATTVASGAKTAATRIGAGYKRVAVDIAKSKVGKTVAKVAKEGAKQVKKAATAVKNALLSKKKS